MTTKLIDVVFSELDDAALDRLAQLLAPRLTDRMTPTVPRPDGWLDSTGAAEYLGLTRNALHKLTAARAIAFQQDGPGCKCWFRRADLDAWRRGKTPSAAKAQPRHLNVELRSLPENEKTPRLRGF